MKFPVLYSESEVAQLCPTLCDPMDCTSQAPLVRELFQAIVLEWVAISFYRGSSQPRDRTRVSCIVGRRFTAWATSAVQKVLLIIYFIYVAATAKSLQSCLTLCDPTDGLLPGSSVPGILQTRTLEWVAISFSNAWKWKVKVKSLSRVWLLATPWTAAYQAPPSMGFSRQDYRSGVPFYV